ncbi:3-methyladenine DNA glycosylase [Corynebacterium sp. TAE3-ERU12]|uniref:3-methyladenine DNA glycosylase n=1 Tax=Corynebacterium sp. TAE3-ERU12 TaxID=2849491 RepID=UPI001C48529F|nr:3-methyladenine DNA glycosylase [Corynebacterium sp. TAE3-ERU12]MBV7295507.1 3-methyladenine DNA glycosylase [Corynebacterium sp. TAE3-ERU12]
MSSASATPTAVAASQWRQFAAAHAKRADGFTAAHRERRSRHERHPVEDFLFDYYPIRPAHLRRWCPGAGVQLADAVVETRDGVRVDRRLAWPKFYRLADDGSATVDVAAFLAARGDTVAYVRNLLRNTSQRPARFSCFGMHEWAMVYRADKPRHPEPLRLGQDGTDEVVENHTIACSHFDAFRFFTEPAKPRNVLQPTRESQPECEQPGCLHAGMDLYKWAAKLGPLVPGELWLDTFELARDIRAVDMAASPYDLSAWGVQPIAVETAEGKAVYVDKQREFTDRGQPLRRALLALADAALGE